jgi:hypothetical protein
MSRPDLVSLQSTRASIYPTMLSLARTASARSWKLAGGRRSVALDLDDVDIEVFRLAFISLVLQGMGQGQVLGFGEHVSNIDLPCTVLSLFRDGGPQKYEAA